MITVLVASLFLIITFVIIVVVDIVESIILLPFTGIKALCDRLSKKKKKDVEIVYE